MENYLQTVTAALNERFGGVVSEYQGEQRVELSAGQLEPAVRALHDEFGFEFNPFITAVDFWPQTEPRFHVYYQFTSVSHQCELRVFVALGNDNPTLPTIAFIYSSANWHERETFDMFGIQFEGHPDMRRLLMPFDWEGHPLRKDYPLGYEEVQFSFNYDQIQKRKPSPTE